MTGQTWTLRCSELGRPLLTNAAHSMNPHKAGKIRREWRDAFTIIARVMRVPPMASIHVETWPEYPDRRSLPDCDATAVSVKGALDGLVIARVIPDDCPPHVASITYWPAVVRPGQPPALVVEVTAA